jgi:hypothetical protein
LLQIIGTPKVCYASERSVVDPNERQMTLKTTNVTFGSFLSMDEVLQYRPHPTDPSKTLLLQQATVSIEGIPLNRYMEDVLTKNISFNASRGRQGLEWVINKINTEVSETRDRKILSSNLIGVYFQVKEIALSADDLLAQTKKSLDTARKSIDDLSTTTQKIHF